MAAFWRWLTLSYVAVLYFDFGGIGKYATSIGEIKR
jgi:hypothetical protein